MAEEPKYKKCQAETSDGSSCKNPAIYPKDEPIACHMESHQKQLGVYEDVPEETKKQVKEAENKEKEVKDEKEEQVKNPFDNTKKHVFSTNRLSHTVLVNYPEDDDRDYFRAEFSGGRWETDDDEKAELLVKTMNKIKAIGKALKKIQ